MNPPPQRMALNPYAPPYSSKAPAAVIQAQMLPIELCNSQQFEVLPSPSQPAGVALGLPYPPGQHLLWHTSVTFSPLQFQRRDDVYRACSQPFRLSITEAGIECSGQTSVSREKKVGASGRRRFVSRRKYVNGQEVMQQKMSSAKKPNAKVVDPPSSSSIVPFQPEDEMFKGKTTSVMIKNIPNQFERHTLLDSLDQHCREENTKISSGSYKPDFTRSEYDFVYLPMDFRRRANKGYAFVNFTSAAAASRFARAFEKYQWRVSVNRKICEVTIAKLQGKDALQNRFKNSVFRCRKDGYLPVVFYPPRDGFIRTPPTCVGRRL